MKEKIAMANEYCNGLAEESANAVRIERYRMGKEVSGDVLIGI